MFSVFIHQPGLAKRICFLAVAFLMCCQPVLAQKEFDTGRGTRHWMMFSDAPNALYHHLAEQAYYFLSKRSKEIAAISNFKEWQKKQQWIQQELSAIIGPFPEKTPLNATITKVIRKEGYQIEHIVYESQPGCYVTASLLIPDNLKGRKAPAVIYCSGHSGDGYRHYANILVNLVKKGFIVLAFDPVGQGERVQYYDSATGRSRFKFPAYEHSYTGAQVFMTGGNIASYFIWDGIRAVDYLLTRPEVDSTRIGITGRSGGGTQSAFIAAFDKRIKALASENYFTNFTKLYKSVGPQDAEQDLPGAIARGIDMADLLLVRAPLPALMITTSRDMFPIQGAIETAAEVSGLYKAYGRANHFSLVSDDAPHASTKKNRESMYAFFQKFLNNPGDPADEPVRVSKDDLRVTPTGQVSTSFRSETVFSLNKKKAQARMRLLEEKRKNVPAYFSNIIAAAKKLSGYRAPQVIADPVFVGDIQRNGYRVEKYFVKGEGDYVIPYLVMKPGTLTSKALIYLNPKGKSDEAEAGGRLEQLVQQGFTVLAPDLIGTGEMGPGAFKGDSYIDSISYNIWFASVLINRSIVGIQAGDVIRLVRLLQRENTVKEIYGLATRQMTPVLLHAAAFDATIKKVALIDPVLSYRQIVMDRVYDPSLLHCTVAGAIGVYDLPDLAASLFPRDLLLAVNKDRLSNNPDLSVIKAAFRKNKTSQKLRIITDDTGILSDAYIRWMNE